MVVGPVAVHTGGGPYLARLIRDGYVQVLLSGNALAVHDIEFSMFGTSLGVDLDTGYGRVDGRRGRAAAPQPAKPPRVQARAR